jgi:hypothetical protein
VAQLVGFSGLGDGRGVGPQGDPRTTLTRARPGSDYDPARTAPRWPFWPRAVGGLARHSDQALAQTSSAKRSMEGGSVDELLDVIVERPVLEQLQVEVGRILEDRVQPGLTGDDREERHVHAVD